ncbi:MULTISPECIES: immunity 51 family protein [unclassified Treponema]|uniref:immunity 51 family protein n=1 Tax=unclassified Treponema TaxID=2638727 RepID=UPI0020A37895|nr:MULTISPECIES: immunity 51 family protein [unclassified Treponema]UTC66577.1 immunity 51 family protein [Treponema sp. OMZ 789]UTC69310.1 immunity 51 family protein [Treponema sp. OMZ 790]UTC72024.1 immunity 51 family protein [Treponema sp. OMZ 791]
MTDLKEKIAPFLWREQENSFSVCLYVGDYKAELFETREDEGFEGNGYDWVSLAKVFLKERKPELIDVVGFDPEADMFCAYSSNESALKTFILSFKETCENDVLIQSLFSKAELD